MNEGSLRGSQPSDSVLDAQCAESRTTYMFHWMCLCVVGLQLLIISIVFSLYINFKKTTKDH